jgi:signal transduction histidine kinase/CheY-like chemotaxis protein
MIEQLFKALNAANAEAILVAMPEAIVRAVSKPLAQRWGNDAAGLQGQLLRKYGGGTLSARQITFPATAEEPATVEICYMPPLGNAITSHFMAEKLDCDDKQHLLLVAQHVSLTQSIAMEENERRLSLAMRSGGYALWDYDFETDVTYNSPEMSAAFGEEVDGQKLTFHTFNRLVHPEDRDKILDEKLRQTTFGQDIFHSRYRVRTTASKYEWIESMAGLVRDPKSGRPVKCVGLLRNIDSQMISLERLKSSERNLRRTQAIAQLGSFSVRVESNVSRLTAELAGLIGMSDAMVHPTLKTFIELIELQDRERFCEALELAKLGQHIKNLEISVRLPSGEQPWFEVSMEPELDASGKVESIFGCCQSITERKLLERRFQQAQKMEAVGQLTGGIAHDFNNLLMVVMGNLQLVEGYVKDDDRTLRRIRAARDAAEKGSDLTRRLLAFSRQQTLQNREIEVNDLIVNMKDMLSQALTAVVELDVVPGKNIWPIKADKTMLESCILNLCINARDAMSGRPAKLIIETANRTLSVEECEHHDEAKPGDYVEISVIDTGSGIAPENIEKVFQPFFTTKEPEKGSGLGLSMIYGFVKQSGGHIKIHSEIGHGTCVKLFVPRRHRNEVTQGSADSTTINNLAVVGIDDALSQSVSAQETILIVEDNDSVREVAAAMLAEMGLCVKTANCGASGLEALESHPEISLILSDVIMSGGMNGPELVAKAKRLRPDLKVLFMSGYAPGNVRLIQDLPDTIDLVNKPFTRDELTRKVKRALAA